jgi:hypothetical protein
MSTLPAAFTNDMLDLLKIFNAHNVQYLIIGAHAVNAYTEARATKDLDIWVNPMIENAKLTYQGLAEFGAPLQNVSIETFTEEDSFFVIGVKPNRVDILKKVPGLEFSAAWKNRNNITISDIPVAVLSFDDVVKAKLAAGRTQDLADVEKLRLAKK